MKIHILSDLHLEFRGWEFSPPPTDADVVVLAGDIHRGTSAIAWANANFGATPVVYVAGNHEYYGGHWDNTLTALRATARANGVYFLEDDEVVIDGVRFVGASLWTDFLLFGMMGLHGSMVAAERTLNDYRFIGASDPGGREVALEGSNPGGERALKASDTIARHANSRRALAAMLATKHAGPTVVVTHHSPSAESVAPRFFGDALNPAFASDLTGFIDEFQPELWIHGHTHDSFDYRRGKTRVICNPRGYRVRGTCENSRFQEDLVVEVELLSEPS